MLELQKPIEGGGDHFDGVDLASILGGLQPRWQRAQDGRAIADVAREQVKLERYQREVFGGTPTERAVIGHAMAEQVTTLMKSRRLIAFQRLRTTLTTRLQLDLLLAKWGLRGRFAQQQSWAAHVRFGSKADIGLGAS